MNKNSDNLKTLLVVILLVFIYPVGVILMWTWMRFWPKWAKWLITVPLIIAILAFIGGVTTYYMSPSKQLKDAQMKYENNIKP